MSALNSRGGVDRTIDERRLPGGQGLLQRLGEISRIPVGYPGRGPDEPVATEQI